MDPWTGSTPRIVETGKITFRKGAGWNQNIGPLTMFFQKKLPFGKIGTAKYRSKVCGDFFQLSEKWFLKVEFRKLSSKHQSRGDLDGQYREIPPNLLGTLKRLSHEIFLPVFRPVWMHLGLNVNRLWFFNFKKSSLILYSYFKYCCVSYETFSEFRRISEKDWQLY